MTVFHYREGHVPLLVSMPHVGTCLSEGLERRLTEAAEALPDTDWHVDQLYDFLDDLGAFVLRARYSRYVVDLNRPPDDESLYPGQDTTGLCPLDTFDREPLYRRGAAPDVDEIGQRRAAYWAPYHQLLESALGEMRKRWSTVVLWDAHSIRSRVPRLFEGRLPDLNLGTAGGKACAPELSQRLLGVAQEAEDHSAVLNGRFTGGYITRHYGAPDAGIHAVQLELAQVAYMDEGAPFTFRDDLADVLRPVLRKLLETALDWATTSR